MARLGRGGAISVVVLLLVALGGGSSWADSAATLTSRVVAKKKPASATLTFVGDTGLAGLATNALVSCNEPAIDGTRTIFLLDQPSDPAVLFNMHVTAKTISIGVYTGSGTEFRGRQFEGTGITGFNPAKGATIDTKLRETTANDPNANPGALGAITSVKGTIRCGSQTAGTSTVSIRGKTADGAIKQGPRLFRVECDQSASQGNFVFFGGVVKVGHKKAIFSMTFRADSINIFESIAGTSTIQRHYMVTSAGVATLSANGARVKGDVIEQPPISGAPHTLHLEGKVKCGTIVTRS